ncbi:MAG: hypothetical protein C0392_15325 [Syntrophus sp. (in: bacteria)]|nr:hypothetical protein [Syntrophus sp. (in: bacteria)]
MVDEIDLITALGFLAGTLTTIAFLPQTIKIIRSRSSGDISLLMMGLNCAGVFCWLIYGFFIHSSPIIASNIITFILIAVTLILAIRHK